MKYRVVIVACLFLLLSAFPALSRAQDGTPVPTPTVDPYADLTIESLLERSYGAGTLQVHQVMETRPGFTRYLISYPSDDLTIYGFMNVPDMAGPFPVIVAIHGYIEPSIYATLDYTTHYADELARAGFLVLHPNLRGYWPSDSGPNMFRVGMAVDILNLIALVRAWGGQPGALEQADPDAIGLWGHSMGGGIVMRVMVIDPEIKAGLLYAAVHADEKENLAHFREDGRGYEKCQAPEESLGRISPINYLDRINAPLSIHHGDQDERVPHQWSGFLYDRLSDLGKTVTYEIYEGQLHTFRGKSDARFIVNSISFFDQHLKPPGTTEDGL